MGLILADTGSHISKTEKITGSDGELTFSYFSQTVNDIA